VAAFSKEESLQHPLDFRLLQNAPVAIYHSAAVLETDLKTLSGLGYRVDRIDLATCSSGQRFYDAISAALEFPSYFGRNRNAFIDVMGDLNIPEQGGRVIVFTNAHRFPQSELSDLVEDLASTARSHLLLGKRLISIIQTDRKDQQFEATLSIALLNPTETWTQSKDPASE